MVIIVSIEQVEIALVGDVGLVQFLNFVDESSTVFSSLTSVFLSEKDNFVSIAYTCAVGVKFFTCLSIFDSLIIVLVLRILEKGSDIGNLSDIRILFHQISTFKDRVAERVDIHLISFQSVGIIAYSSKILSTLDG